LSGGYGKASQNRAGARRCKSNVDEDKKNSQSNNLYLISIEGDKPLSPVEIKIESTMIECGYSGSKLRNPDQKDAVLYQIPASTAAIMAALTSAGLNPGERPKQTPRRRISMEG
jgi:hypothetical protein